MQLLEATLVLRDEIVDNNREKEELEKLFDIYHSWTKVAPTLGVYEESVLKVLALLKLT